MLKFALAIIGLVGLSCSMRHFKVESNLYLNSIQLQSALVKLKNISNASLTERECIKSERAYKIAEFGNKTSNLSAIIVCNVHARQLLTSEVCLAFIKNAIQKDQQMLRKVHFRVFYTANQMRDAVISGQYCRRTNFNNVDINRNFPTGYTGQKFGKQTNPGPSALSEPFSQCIEEEVNSWKPNIFLDVHTGQFSIYYHNKSKQQTKVISQVVKQACSSCRFREQQGLEGVMFADMKVRKGIKWANLFQIFGGYNQKLSQNDNCFTIFNPKTKNTLQFYIKKGKKMLITYFNQIIKFESRKIQ